MLTRDHAKLKSYHVLKMKLSILFVLAALSVRGQTNVPPLGIPGDASDASAGLVQNQTNQTLALLRHEERVRAACASRSAV